MSIPRFVVNQDYIEGSEALIYGSDAKQIRTVLRMAPGDNVEIISEGSIYSAILDSIDSDCVKAIIIEKIETKAEPPIYLAIALAILKGDKLDFIIQKCTEIGASEFILFHSNRCIPRLDKEKLPSRIARLSNIAKESTEQSRRCKVPSVKGVINIRDIKNLMPQFDLSIICNEQEKRTFLADLLLREGLPKRVLLAVGPEGGLTEEENIFLISNGAKSATFGNRILRSETAAVAASAIIIHEYERVQSST